MPVRPPHQPNPEADYLSELRRTNRLNLEWGVQQGWWDAVSPEGEPIKYRDFKLADHPSMATIMVALGVFPSVTQARKNGWDKKTEVGTQVVTKRRIWIRVSE